VFLTLIGQLFITLTPEHFTETDSKMCAIIPAFEQAILRAATQELVLMPPAFVMIRMPDK
jgi:hypothetical protein